MVVLEHRDLAMTVPALADLTDGADHEPPATSSRRHNGTPAGVDGYLPACFSIDAAGRIADWTIAAERLVGWTASRANGRRADDLLIAHSSLSSYHAELAMLATGGPTDGWLRVSVNHWDGRQVQVGLSLSRVTGNHGIHLHVAMRSGNAEEIGTDGRGPDREHPILHSLLAGLGASAGVDGIDGAVVCDSSGHVFVRTGVLAEIFGPAEGRAEDGSWAAMVAGIRHGDGRPMPRHALPLVRALRGDSFRESHLIVDQIEGPRRILLANGQPLHDRTGRLLGAWVTVREIE